MRAARGGEKHPITCEQLANFDLVIKIKVSSLSSFNKMKMDLISQRQPEMSERSKADAKGIKRSLNDGSSTTTVNC